MKAVRYTSYLFVVMFGLFAYWQANDPDGPLWLLIYAFAAGATYFAYRNAVGRWSARVFSLLTLAGGFWLMPDDLGNWIEVEEAREGFGLLICAVVTGGLSLTRANLAAPR